MMVTSEESGLCLKFNFTSSWVSQKFLGCLLVPYLGTPCSRSQKRPILCFSYSHFWSPWTLPRHPVNEFSMYPDLLKNWSWGQGCSINVNLLFMIYVIFSKEKIRRMTAKATCHTCTATEWYNGGLINVMTAVLRASLVTHHYNEGPLYPRFWPRCCRCRALSWCHPGAGQNGQAGGQVSDSVLS